jgi:hypothetical protein
MAMTARGKRQEDGWGSLLVASEQIIRSFAPMLTAANYNEQRSRLIAASAETHR